MIESFARWAQPVLDLPIVRRTRRNHGLEHATIHLLSGRINDLKMAGRSDSGGFVLIGAAPTEMIESAVRDALRRMRNGEHHLAVHPNCGTNLVTTGFLTTTAAMIGFTGSTRRGTWERLPMVTMLVMFTILFSQPLGLSLQRHLTTDGDPADLEIVNITRREMPGVSGGTVIVHRVNTRSS
ncbi:MAG: DUF6391 domain-containing protein [Anaerolineae bacterium]